MIEKPAVFNYANYEKAISDLVDLSDRYAKLEEMYKKAKERSERTGKWIPCESIDGKEMVRYDFKKCSICGGFGFMLENSWGDYIAQTRSDYCPDCGAKMEDEI